MGQPSMRKSLPEVPTGRHRQEYIRDLPRNAQPELSFPDPQPHKDAISDGYETLRQAVTVSGGRKLLALSLGKDIDYESKISNGLNRSDDRHAFFDWLFPLLAHREAGPLLLALFCRVAKHEMPVRLPDTFSIEDENRALRAALKRRGKLEDDILEEAAEELGTDVASLRRTR
jgi:hypothetical protein